MPSWCLHSGSFPPARLLSRASLLPAHVRVATGRRPVALAVGQLDPPRIAANGTAPSARKAAVVVLTAGWSLLCFDHNLQLLWENALGDSLPQSWAPREVALLVASHPLHPGDRGLVIVAASASRPEAGVGGEGWVDPLAEEVAWEARLSRGRHPGRAAGSGAGGGGVDVRHHVNYYAFEGRTGAARWRHESPDFHPPGDALADSLVPQHSYKLDAASLEGRHAGETACREYREAVAAAMPHSWARPADTRLRLAHWAKHRVQVSGSAAHGAPGSLASSPNVVVAHLQDGLEAVHLASGHTVCKLPLARGHLHADLNADGVVDHVAAAGWRAGSAGRHRAPHCVATVTSGSPGRPLVNGSVCRALHLLPGAHGRQHWQSGGDPPGGVPIELAPPAAVAAYGAGSRAARRRWDVVFLNSRGDVTSFSHDGRRHFQLRTDADWGAVGGAPTLHALLLRAGSTVPALLVAGERVALLLSPAGSQLARLALPSKPVGPLQVVDLAGDGTAGLLLHTQVGVFAYRQLQRPGTLPLAFILGALLLVGLALSMASADSAARSTDFVDDLRPRDD